MAMPIYFFTTPSPTFGRHLGFHAAEQLFLPSLDTTLTITDSFRVVIDLQLNDILRNEPAIMSRWNWGLDF